MSQPKKPSRKSQSTQCIRSRFAGYAQSWSKNAKFFKPTLTDVVCRVCKAKYWTGEEKRYETLNKHIKKKHNNQDPPQPLKPRTPPAVKMVRQLNIAANSNHRTALKLTFQCAFFIAALLQPMWLLPCLLVFLHYLTLKCSFQYSCNGNRHEIYRAIAAAIRARLDTNIKHSPFVAFSCDESTDCSTMKNLILYIAYFDCNSYEFKEDFIKLHEFARDPTGKDLAEIIINVFQNEYSFKRNQIISCATDGAGVMLGRHKGMTRFICAFYPYCICSHCMPHKLQLGVDDALKKNSMWSVVQKLVRLVYSMFSKSFSYNRKLKDKLIALKKEFKKIKKEANTRWLSRYSSILSVIESLLGLFTLFLDDTSTKGKRIYRKLCNIRYMLFLHYMADILHVLFNLSKFLQQTNNKMHYGDLSREILYVQQLVESLSSRSSSGKHLKGFARDIEQGVYVDFGVERISEYDWQWCEKEMSKVNDSMQLHLSARFQASPILDATRIFDFDNAKLDVLSDAAFELHGNDEIKKLCEWFGRKKKAYNITTSEDATINSTDENNLQYETIYVIETVNRSRPRIVGDQETINAPIDHDRCVEQWGYFRIKMKIAQLRKESEKYFYDTLYREFFQIEKRRNELKLKYGNELNEFELNEECPMHDLHDVILLSIICKLILRNSANCERGYATMNDIKKCKRNKLGTNLLSCLMMTKLCGPRTMEAFDAIYDDCFDIWWRMKTKRYGLKQVELAVHKINSSCLRQTNKKTEKMDLFDLMENVFMDCNEEWAFDCEKNINEHDDSDQCDTDLDELLEALEILENEKIENEYDEEKEKENDEVIAGNDEIDDSSSSSDDDDIPIALKARLRNCVLTESE